MRNFRIYSFKKRLSPKSVTADFWIASFNLTIANKDLQQRKGRYLKKIKVGSRIGLRTSTLVSNGLLSIAFSIEHLVF